MTDIEKISSELTMLAVLKTYGIADLRMKENSLSGCCPIHKGDNPNAFHVNLDKNLWNCFTRQHGGDVLTFIMEYEGIAFKEAAGIAMEMLNLPCARQTQAVTTKNSTKKEKINLPLTFTLKLDPHNVYLRERRVEKNTIKHFGIGYCNKGSMNGRIAIPVHDENGNLVAYCGRSINNERPKYKFPTGFNKSLVLFNFHRVKKQKVSTVIIVEGFFDVFKIHQAGFPNVIALMGSSISKKQQEFILSLQRRLIVLLDGDEAGKRGTKKIINALKGKLQIQVKYLPEGTQPDKLSDFELLKILNERRFSDEINWGIQKILRRAGRT